MGPGGEALRASSSPGSGGGDGTGPPPPAGSATGRGFAREGLVLPWLVAGGILFFVALHFSRRLLRPEVAPAGPPV
eukprot:tig00021072_g17997.t1